MEFTHVITDNATFGMNMAQVEENLMGLTALKEDFENDIICAFEDFEEDGETSVIVSKSSNDGYDYVAYVNTENSIQFLLTVEEYDNDDFDRMIKITKVSIA
jgi:hypothetical protein